MASLTIEHITKNYGNTQVLNDISLDIRSGEFISLLGPSGCGKTTLLRIIAGLESVSDGAVRIDGTDVVHLPPEDRDIAMMFQSYALFPHMSVHENVRFPLRMRRRGSRAEQDTRVRAALDTIKMSSFADRMPRQLSGGQQQRVALARAIVSDPKILLLDEPLSNLDARLREEMQVELIRLHRRLGLTTVFVTHDQDEALSLSDRVILMNSGHIEQSGSPSEIYANPKTCFASDFLGSANLIPVKIKQTNSQSRAVLPNGMSLEIADASDRTEGVLVLRQEDLKLNPPETARDMLQATVSTRVYLGGRTRYLLDLGGIEIRCLATAGDNFEVGDTVSISVSIERRMIIRDTKI